MSIIRSILILVLVLFAEAGLAQNRYLIAVDYSPIDLLIPSKYGASVGYYENPQRSWELEYLHGGLSVPIVVEDLGKMSDDRISVLARSTFGESGFNLSYGLSYFRFAVHLGDKFLNRLSYLAEKSSLDLVEVQSWGPTIAVGHRWNIGENATLGVDWVSWSQPLIITKKSSDFLNFTNNDQDREDVEKAVKFISYFPRFSFLKVQLGYSF